MHNLFNIHKIWWKCIWKRNASVGQLGAHLIQSFLYRWVICEFWYVASGLFISIQNLNGSTIVLNPGKKYFLLKWNNLLISNDWFLIICFVSDWCLAVRVPCSLPSIMYGIWSGICIRMMAVCWWPGQMLCIQLMEFKALTWLVTSIVQVMLRAKVSVTVNYLIVIEALVEQSPSHGNKALLKISSVFIRVGWL